MEKLTSVRADRTLSRCGVFATGSRQLTLPVEARGLSEVIVASGSLRLTPDYDVLAWFCERWATRPTDSGWMRPTLYELGSDLYDTAPWGEHYRTLRDSLSRLARVSVTVWGIDGETAEPHPDAFIEGGLLDWTGNNSLALSGRYRPGVQLAGWLRNMIDQGAPMRLPWRVLRAFDENQKLAKRLWIYLAAERWKPAGTREREGTWIACGDRLFAALGMGYGRHRDARAALARACATVRRVDPRYAAGTLELRKLGHSWRIDAERPSWESWRELKPEYEEARRAITASLRRAA